MRLRVDITMADLSFELENFAAWAFANPRARRQKGRGAGKSLPHMSRAYGPEKSFAIAGRVIR